MAWTQTKIRRFIYIGRFLLAGAAVLYAPIIILALRADTSAEFILWQGMLGLNMLTTLLAWRALRRLAKAGGENGRT